MSNIHIFVFFLLILITKKCTAIWCYRCNSATPGCAEEFNWHGVGYLGEPCPEDNDICIKIIEKRDAKSFITRDCLSSIRGLRKDIPADTYEGCRPATKDVNLAHYVNNSIKELDVRRDYYTDVQFCFCFLDHRCNGSTALLNKFSLIILLSIILLQVI